MRHRLIGVMGALAALWTCSPEGGDRPVHRPPQTSASPAGAGDLYSNILREDYVGPEACGKCHKENYARWKSHPHSRMNMPAGAGSVLGDFSGGSLSYGDGQVAFRKEGELFTMEYSRGGQTVRRFKVTRTIGWRYLQEYVGVQIQGPEPPGDALYTEETRLAFGYALRERRWIPQSYLDAQYDEPEWKPDGRLRYDPFVPERSPFNKRCIHCHNTYPYELRLYSGEQLHGFPPAPARAVRALLQDRPSHRDQLDNPLLPASSLVTVGISCESCHFGGREHAREGGKPIRFVPAHPKLSDWPSDPVPTRKNPAVVNSICRQCHFSGWGTWADGSAILNSMESIEQDRGACTPKLSCLSCHNPHERGPDAGAPVRQDHVASCLSCHGKFGSPEAARRHARHDPERISCLDCHMPRIVHGFDEMNRTHRISSPSEPAILGSGMPNACNLCHLDRSLAWTRDALNEGWGKRIALPRALEGEFGTGHSKPAGEAWLDQPIGMLRAVVGAAYARSPLARQAQPRLLKLLDEPNAYVRTWSLRNVERALGRRLSEEEFSLTAPPEKRALQLERLLKQHSGR